MNKIAFVHTWNLNKEMMSISAWHSTILVPSRFQKVETGKCNQNITSYPSQTFDLRKAGLFFSSVPSNFQVDVMVGFRSKPEISQNKGNNEKMFMK